jgi:hypothetical protein
LPVSFTRSLLGGLFIVASLALPVVVTLLAAEEVVWWLAVACLVTGIVNVSVVAVRRRGRYRR